MFIVYFWVQTTQLAAYYSKLSAKIYFFLFFPITGFFLGTEINTYYFSPVMFMAVYWHQSRDLFPQDLSNLISELRRLGWTRSLPDPFQHQEPVILSWRWSRDLQLKGGWGQDWSGVTGSMVQVHPGLQGLMMAGTGPQAGLRDTTGHGSWLWGLCGLVKPPRGAWKMCNCYQLLYLLLEAFKMRSLHTWVI